MPESKVKHSQESAGRLIPASQPELPEDHEASQYVPSRASLESGDTLTGVPANLELDRTYEDPRTPKGREAFVPPSRVEEYEILRPLGRGSMGQVFLAHDTVLDRKVAVKFVSTRATQADRERFLIEARAIARMQHAHIVAIFRVGEIDGHPYLVSEFINGQSLERVKKPMPWIEALRIGQSLASGLAAAHEHGVLHRDIKPGNVMLARDGTVKLLDFGLAKLTDVGPARVPFSLPRLKTERATEGPALPSQPSLPPVGTDAESGDVPPLRSRPGAGSHPSLTADGALLGTPWYMAPECWLGESVTESADVYALGALLYELCSGSPPHNHSDIKQICAAALDHDAVPLSVAKPEIPAPLSAIIARCLKRKSAERYASARELAEALRALSEDLTTPTITELLVGELRRRWPLALLFTTVLLALSVSALYPLLHRSAAADSARSAGKQRRAVAMLGVWVEKESGPGPETPQLARAAAALSELLGEELVAGERLGRVPADTVARMKLELGVSSDEQLSAAMLQHIRSYIHADLVTTGTLKVVGTGTLEVGVRVLACKSGVQVASAKAQGRTSELFDLVERLGADLRAQLGTGELSGTEVGELRATRPASPELAQLFADGKERMRRFDTLGARDTLLRVVAQDPDYPLAHLSLAEVFATLGNDARARSEAERAYRLSAHLSREQRILIEARYRELGKDLDKALGLYQSLVAFFPDSLEYGLHLANIQIGVGKAADALATLRRLRSLPPPASQDPRLNLTEALAKSDQTEYEPALALLGKAIEQGDAIGAPLLGAKARLEGAYLLEMLGRHQEALTRAEQARQAFAAAGDRFAVADTLILKGGAYSQLGLLDQATEIASQVVAQLLESQNSQLLAVQLTNLGQLLCRQGRLGLAQAHAQGGLALGRELDANEAIGSAHTILGWIETLSGRFDAAQRSFEQAEQVFVAMSEPRMTAWVRWHRGQMLLAQGQLAKARELHQSALELRLKHNLQGFAAESRSALAELALEEGRPADAETLARAAAAQFAADQQKSSEAVARALLALSVALAHRPSEARAELALALTLNRDSQDLLDRLRVQRLAAGVRALIGSREEGIQAESELRAVVSEARAQGLIYEELRAQLGEHLIALQKGRLRQPEQTLAALADAAEKRGIGLVSQLARAALPSANLPSHAQQAN